MYQITVFGEDNIAIFAPMPKDSALRLLLFIGEAKFKVRRVD